MAILNISSFALTGFFLLFLHLRGGNAKGHFKDDDYVELALNLEYLETEFFLFGALGYGLDRVNPSLTMNGSSPFGGKQANLTPLVNDTILQFGYQEVGHLRAIKSKVAGFPRPLLNISAENFAAIMDSAANHTLIPPFDPFANDINYLLASYLIPYVGLTGYVGAAPKLIKSDFKKLVAGLLGVESGQDAVIRTLLYQQWFMPVRPFRVNPISGRYYTVADFTNMISAFRDKLGGEKLIKDEGIRVDIKYGAEGKTEGNVLAGDEHSLSYDRTPKEILNIVYGRKDGKPGGFFPRGAGGKFAQSYPNI